MKSSTTMRQGQLYRTGRTYAQTAVPCVSAFWAWRSLQAQLNQHLRREVGPRMLNNLKLLSSRRAYEFAPDEIRLTLLSMQPVSEFVKQSLGFQSAVLGTPMPTFGEAEYTFPLGVVFNNGVFQAAEQRLIPIRYLHIEARRVVIDVAGPSSAIDSIFETLNQQLANVRASDGSPALGKPAKILDVSEFSFHLSAGPDELLPPELRTIVTDALSGSAPGGETMAVIPAFRIHLQAADALYAGWVPNPDASGFMLYLPAGPN